MNTRFRLGARDEQGFTLVEMIVALGLLAFIMVALAALLGSSLKTLGIQKGRTQGNEVATLGMEDLQRLSYDGLGVCSMAPGPAPAGLSDPAMLSNCATPNEADPCVDTAGDVPDTSYQCRRGAIDYNVRRYIAWGNPSRTEKRLAVFVNWTDASGPHEVSQQSSLRIPGRGAIVGVAAPPLVTTVVNPTDNTVASDGTLSGDITLQAQTSGLAASVGDSVVVAFNALDGGIPTGKTVTLTSSDGSNWSGVIPASGNKFGTGSQFLTFTAIRKNDGKVGSRIHLPPLTFCPSGGCPTDLPQIAGVNVDGDGVVDIDSTGLLDQPEFVLTASTTNVAPEDTVVAIVETTGGASSLALTADVPGFACDHLDPTVGCTATWTARIPQSAGIRFLSGTDRKVYFAVYQGIGPNAVSKGSTSAKASPDVTFG